MARGIEAACWGTATKDGELRQSKAGNDFGIVNIAVSEGKTDDTDKEVSTFVKILLFSGLPVDDEDVMLRMLQTVETKRGDKISNVRIISREFKLLERTLIFEGIATIEPGPKGWWQRTAR